MSKKELKQEEEKKKDREEGTKEKKGEKKEKQEAKGKKTEKTSQKQTPSKAKVQLPDIVALLKSGVHFGHKTSKWHPSMESHIFAERRGVHIIDLAKTRERLKEALIFLKKIAKDNGVILFVCTKEQVQEKVSEAARSVSMPSVTTKWIGGTITNWSVIKKQILKLRKRREEKEKNEWTKYTKKEQLLLEEHLKKLEYIYGGVDRLEKLPDALFIIDCKKSKTAINEAVARSIPIVALCDTNVDIRNITYPIPANDDAIKSVSMLLNSVTQAIAEAKGITLKETGTKSKKGSETPENDASEASLDSAKE